MKKLFAMVLILAMLLSFAACENTGGPDDSDEETYTVGISMFVMDAGMTNLSALMEETLDAADIKIEHYVTSADSSMEKQNSDIEDLITRGCDLIWVQGFDKDAISGAIESAIAQGVKIAVASPVNSDAYTYQYQNASTEATGLMQAEWFAENYLAKNPDKTFKIALCNGTMSTSGGLGRHDGVIHGLEQSGYTNYEIVVDQDCNYITETAQAWAEGLMTSHPEVEAIFCGNDDMALGVANAIDAVGRTGEIVLMGTDGMDVGLGLMNNGQMQMTVKLNVQEIGAGMANSMIECLKGTLEVDENKMVYGDASKLYTTVDETNLNDFLG